jgi:hypothetical protein
MQSYGLSGVTGSPKASVLEGSTVPTSAASTSATCNVRGVPDGKPPPLTSTKRFAWQNFPFSESELYVGYAVMVATGAVGAIPLPEHLISKLTKEPSAAARPLRCRSPNTDALVSVHVIPRVGGAVPGSREALPKGSLAAGALPDKVQHILGLRGSVATGAPALDASPASGRNLGGMPAGSDAVAGTAKEVQEGEEATAAEEQLVAKLWGGGGEPDEQTPQKSEIRDGSTAVDGSCAGAMCDTTVERGCVDLALQEPLKGPSKGGVTGPPGCGVESGTTSRQDTQGPHNRCHHDVVRSLESVASQRNAVMDLPLGPSSLRSPWPRQKSSTNESLRGPESDSFALPMSPLETPETPFNTPTATALPGTCPDGPEANSCSPEAGESAWISVQLSLSESHVSSLDLSRLASPNAVDAAPNRSNLSTPRDGVFRPSERSGPGSLCGWSPNPSQSPPFAGTKPTTPRPKPPPLYSGRTIVSPGRATLPAGCNVLPQLPYATAGCSSGLLGQGHVVTSAIALVGDSNKACSSSALSAARESGVGSVLFEVDSDDGGGGSEGDGGILPEGSKAALEALWRRAQGTTVKLSWDRTQGLDASEEDCTRDWNLVDGPASSGRRTLSSVSSSLPTDDEDSIEEDVQGGNRLEDDECASGHSASSASLSPCRGYCPSGYSPHNNPESPLRSSMSDGSRIDGNQGVAVLTLTGIDSLGDTSGHSSCRARFTPGRRRARHLATVDSGSYATTSKDVGSQGPGLSAGEDVDGGAGASLDRSVDGSPGCESSCSFGSASLSPRTKSRDVGPRGDRTDHLADGTTGSSGGIELAAPAASKLPAVHEPAGGGLEPLPQQLLLDSASLLLGGGTVWGTSAALASTDGDSTPLLASGVSWGGLAGTSACVPLAAAAADNGAFTASLSVFLPLPPAPSA